MRKWGVSNFGTLSPFESKLAKSDFLGPTARSQTNAAHLGPSLRLNESGRLAQESTGKDEVIAEISEAHLRLERSLGEI